mmetsp:Transcript_15905/g.46410  ORF Transcript_15905/g.46410 Transcript_15905/m.46410 type:complete len:235 (-) Transcript_15905:25-729(-)
MVAKPVLESCGKPIYVAQHFFDTPVAQPRRSNKEADLTGLRLWHCAIPLLAYLQVSVLPALATRAADEGRTVRILELGAGVGLLGTALAAAEEVSVVLTDPAINLNFDEGREGNTLDHLASNVELNADATGGRAVVRKLLWGNDADIEAIRNEFPMPFDLITGSDLIYDPDNYPALLRTCKAFCTNECTEVYLGFQPRHPGERRFFEQAEEAFYVSTISIEDKQLQIARLQLMP